MRFKSTTVAGVAGLLALVAHHRAADAATCDSLVLTDAPEDVVIGEAGTVLCSQSVGCFFRPYSTPRLGVCVTEADGSEVLFVLDCTTAQVTGDMFSLATQGGDDRVAVLKDAHTVNDSRLLPAGGGTGAMYCGSGVLAPWHPDFDFGLSVTLGTGADLFHGSENADVVLTNAVIGSLSGGFSSPADGSMVDQACGWGGNDRLYGDRDDSWQSGIEDHLDGGAGTDTCDGDHLFNGDDYGDVAQSCETSSDAWVTSGFFRCTDTDDPIHDW